MEAALLPVACSADSEESDMGLMDNLKRNVGGWGGGLTAFGDAMTAMSAGMSSAPGGSSHQQVLGRGLAMAGDALGNSFEKNRARVDDENFRAWAGEQAEGAEEGSAVRELMTAVAAGDAGDNYRKLLPSYWNARAMDRKAASAGQMSTSQARMRSNIESRRQRFISSGTGLMKGIYAMQQGRETELNSAMQHMPGETPEEWRETRRFRAWVARNGKLENAANFVPYDNFGWHSDGSLGEIKLADESTGGGKESGDGKESGEPEFSLFSPSTWSVPSLPWEEEEEAITPPWDDLGNAPTDSTLVTPEPPPTPGGGLAAPPPQPGPQASNIDHAPKTAKELARARARSTESAREWDRRAESAADFVGDVASDAWGGLLGIHERYAAENEQRRAANAWGGNKPPSLVNR